MINIKLFPVNCGDLVYIKHNRLNFTTIDCCLSYDNKGEVLKLINSKEKGQLLKRVIPTQNGTVHEQGSECEKKKVVIANFCCVESETITKRHTDIIDDYRRLKDSPRAFYLYKEMYLKWLNEEGGGEGDNVINRTGVTLIWPAAYNDYMKYSYDAKKGENPINISPIIRYGLDDGISFAWLSDLETDLIYEILEEVEFTKVNILFANYRGRNCGRVPDALLRVMDPDLIIAGQPTGETLDYSEYSDFNVITQKTLRDIFFECSEGKVDIFVSSPTYSVSFLKNSHKRNRYGGYYLGTLDV